jgi:hypothetical protein
VYGKVFESIYDGTLAGHWQAIVTMQQLIVLSNADGIVDMTAEAIARRTTIPMEIIEAGLAHLAKPDPYSRTPGDDGRRIVLLDDHRPWGWRLVNHAKYKALRDMEQKRAADRERMAEKRKKNKTVAMGSPDVAKVAHAYADANKTLPPPSGAFLRFWAAWPRSERKQARGKCWELWRRKDFDLQSEAILLHVDGLKHSDGWRRGFVPAPFTYLNQRRWDGAEPPDAPGERKVAM